MVQNPDSASLPTLPDRWHAFGFWLRRHCLIAIRIVSNARDSSLKRWSRGTDLLTAPIVAQVRMPLWTDGRPAEFALVAGKVHNLRVSLPAFHGIEMPAGAVFSFWRQLGRPARGRGFVVGREIRSGCVVPTIAGGICQISNALATCAQMAGFELVERHAHSARIEHGMQGFPTQIDATVFWNYIDLRIRSTQPWRIEFQMTSSEMVLSLRSWSAKQVPIAKPGSIVPVRTVAQGSKPVARSCLTCEETTCFRHRPSLAGEMAERSEEAWLLNAWTPEFADFLESQPKDRARLVLWPARVTPRQRRQTTGWHTHAHVSTGSRTAACFWTALRRSAWLRWHAGTPGRRQASILDGDRWLAQRYIAALRPEHCRLIVDQSLVPYLWQADALAGRQFIVLAGALPMAEITRRLDLAAERRPGSASLRDFRGDPGVHAAEIAGLQAASKLVTPHADVAAYLSATTGTPVQRLDWVLPPQGRGTVRERMPGSAVRTIVLATAALPRKGVLDLEQAIEGLHCRVLVLGPPHKTRASPASVAGSFERVDAASDWLAKADVVVLPAYVEHSPRAALTALAAGVPVIASTACGLSGLAGVSEIAAGDVAQLRAALVRVLWPETASA